MSLGFRNLGRLFECLIQKRLLYFEAWTLRAVSIPDQMHYTYYLGIVWSCDSFYLNDAAIQSLNIQGEQFVIFINMAQHFVKLILNAKVYQCR